MAKPIKRIRVSLAILAIFVIVAYIRHTPTIRAYIGTFKSADIHALDPGLPIAIQRFSKELRNHANSVNVELDWNIDISASYPGSAERTNCAQYEVKSGTLSYLTGCIGDTYEYRNVTPNKLHLIARQRATDLDALTKLGCPLYLYDNDMLEWNTKKTRIK